MKNTFKKWMALSLALITLAGSAASCKSKNKTTADAGQSSLPSVSEDGSITTTPSAGESALFVPFTYTDMGYTDHAALSRLAAGEGMVLLENENDALPFKKGERVALFGKGQIDFYKGGTGSGDVNAPYVVNLLDGMRKKAKEGKITVYEELAKKYEKNSDLAVTEAMVKQAAKNADAAVMVISRNTGEMYDRANSLGNYRLSAKENKLLEQICAAGFKKVVVVLNIPAVIDTSFMDDYGDIDSLLVAWQPGMEGGNAVADILCADMNPSGKLADTMVYKYTDYITAKTFNKYPKEEQYTEDIYVGYRYFETFDPEYKKVRYPFGYGLSYTDFEISNVKVACDGIYVKVTADVKNVGDIAGKEVLQVYYSAPQGKLGNPAKELAGYAKTELLQPGKSQSVSLSFAVSDMASYDDTGKVVKSAYILEKGDYCIFVGNSIKDAGAQGVRYTYTVKENTITEQLSAKLIPSDLEKRLLASGKYEKLDTFTTGIALSGAAKVMATSYSAHSTELVSLDSGKSGKNGATGVTSLAVNTNISFNLNCPESGEYTFILYFGAAGKNSYTDAVTVIAGEQRASADYTCSGGLYKTSATTEVKLTLEKGVNIVKIKNEKISGANLFSHMIVLCPGSTLEDYKGDPAESVYIEFPAVKKTISSFIDVYNDPTLLSSFVNGLTLDELCALLEGKGATISGGTGTIGTNSSLDIAGANTADGPAGLRLSKAQTAWPIGTLMACTFNQNLVYNMGLAVGDEMVENKVDVWLAPGMNIHRDPMCGRNFEYYSEDPYLTGMTATAIALGVQSKGVGVMIKHFALNNRESERKYCDSQCSERAIREIYLKGFEICVKNAKPWAIMSSYNKINGTYSSENKELLTDILRGEWGFEGLVSTDWENKAAKFKEPSAGNDISMPNGNAEALKAGFAAGLLTIEDLRTCATRVLQVVLKSQAMENFAYPEAVILPANEALRIKAVNWARKADRIGTEACEDEDRGNNPKFTEVNTFLTYYVDAQQAGEYSFSFRLASPNGGGAFDLYVDGKKIGNYKVGKNTGGWQSWDTFADVLCCELSKGRHEIKIVFTAEQININWFEIKKK
ncbi:MAG: glycoside hydrolase family 3 C-terminal domain-containing protein [Clostridia bacterium]|nr:glycoside hydrolase family 3 C-terminal domain-containing protein [Clostridia bacterium]